MTLGSQPRVRLDRIECHPQVAAKGNMRKAAKIRELYKDIRRQCVLFDDLHCICTADLSNRRWVVSACISKPVQAVAHQHHD